MSYRIKAWVVACALSLAGAAHAEDADRQKLAGELFTAMRGEQMIDQLAQLYFQTISGNYRTRIAEAGTCPAADSVLDVYQEESRQLLITAFKDGNFFEKTAAIYAREFTAEELQVAIDFYRSSAGQKFLAKQPELMRQGAALGQAMMAAKQQDLKAFADRIGTAMSSALESCKQK